MKLTRWLLPSLLGTLACLICVLVLTKDTGRDEVADRPKVTTIRLSHQAEQSDEILDLPEDEQALAPRPKSKACWKDSESRGRGSMPDPQTRQCPENLERSMGLCYPHCGPKRVGFGPLCLDDCTAFDQYKSSAALFCCQTDEICRDLMVTVSRKVPRALVQLAIEIATNPNDARKIAAAFRAFLSEALNLRLPLCSRLPSLADDEERAELSVTMESDTNDGTTVDDDDIAMS